jgi:hypothetical protein
MRKKILISNFIAVLLVTSLTSEAQKSGTSGGISNFSDFESSMPPVRVAGNPIMKHGGWADGQLEEPCILENPKDSSRLIMFYSGANLVKNNGGKCGIAKAWAYKKNPLKWFEYPDNPIINYDPAVKFEAVNIRLDCVLYHAESDEYWIYYTGTGVTPSGSADNAIGLACCSAGADGYSNITKTNIKKYSGNPVLTPSGQGRNDGTFVSQAALIKVNGTYYMYYSYRGEEVLPGIRYATSSDGKIWAKQGKGDILSRGPEGGPDSRYFEWHQVFRAFDKYIIVWEAFNRKEWSVCMASSDTPDGTWTKSPKNPIFRPSGIDGTFDKTFVATPAFYLINNKWYLYYQGAGEGGDYIYNTWDMGAAELVKNSNPQ